MTKELNLTRRVRLIPEARRAWRYASVRFGLAVPLLIEGWLSLSEQQRADLLTWAGVTPERLVSVGALIAVLLRVMTAQPPADKG